MVDRKKKEPAKAKTSKIKVPIIYSGDYQVKLNHGGQFYEATGQTLYEAISNIPLDWVQVKTKGTITVSKDDKTYEHFFYLKHLRRMFANKIMRHAYAKNLEYLFNIKAKENTPKNIQ